MGLGLKLFLFLRFINALYGDVNLFNFFYNKGDDLLQVKGCILSRPVGLINGCIHYSVKF